MFVNRFMLFKIKQGSCNVSQCMGSVCNNVERTAGSRSVRTMAPFLESLHSWVDLKWSDHDETEVPHCLAFK